MIKKVAVIGAGIMGGNIGLACALAGYEVSITRKNAALLEKTKEEISAAAGLLVSEGVISEADQKAALDRIACLPDLREAVSGAQLVIEAVTEKLPVKHAVFAEVEGYVSSGAILASNSSTFPVTQIAEVLKNPARACSLHFYNPAHLIPLVEVVPGRATSRETVEELYRFAESIGKKPVTCKESPGFLGVRLQAALVTEAFRMLAEGVATAEDIDAAVSLSFGFRLAHYGPLRIVDLGGVDTFVYAYDFMADALHDEKWRAPEAVRNMVAEGRLGVKTGQGFYDYRDVDGSALRLERDRKFIAQLKSMGYLKGR
jgi:3-hydroxybutyryl-CoA dehydrogenase